MDEANQDFNKYVQPIDFERLTSIVSSEFQIEEALIEHNIPTYYLKQSQETKKTFVRLLENLRTIGLIALLRKKDGKVVLRVVPGPTTKPSNVLINWLLFFATIGTTFLTGYLLTEYLLPRGVIDPLIGGATFTIAIMAALGLHETGHMIAASQHKVKVTAPYFIPGPPPIGPLFGVGTFGAVILQKQLPPNRDALFDIGVSGPILGFIVTVLVTFVGVALSPARYMFPEGPFMSLPILFDPIGKALAFFGLSKQGNVISLHPVAFAGYVGMIVTMLNLLPTGMLDGGHIAKCIVGDKFRMLLTILSVVLLAFLGYYPMAVLVLFLSMYRHPGPLDDVSKLSKTRKLLVPALIVIFLLCGIPGGTPVHKLEIQSNVTGVPFSIYYTENMCYNNQTPWLSEALAEGSYVVCLNSTVVIDSSVYIFAHWENGDTNRNRTITLTSDVTINAIYTQQNPQ